METIAAPTVEQPQPVQVQAVSEDDPTTAEQRELLREELRAAIRRKVAHDA